MKFFKNCDIEKNNTMTPYFSKMPGMGLQRCLFTILPSILLGDAECTARNEESIQQPAETNTTSDIESTESSVPVQDPFKKCLDIQNAFFDFILNEPENLDKYHEFVDKIDEISLEISGIRPADESKMFIWNTMKFASKYSGMAKPMQPGASGMGLNYCYRICRIYCRSKIKFILAMGAITNNLDERCEPLNKATRKELTELCGINKEVFYFSGKLNSQEICRIMQKDRLKNLKILYLLIYRKSKLSRAESDEDLELYTKNSGFLNFIIRESILLNYKFENATLEKLGTVETIGSLISGLKENYNLLCAYFLYFLYAKKSSYKECSRVMIGENQDFLPIKNLFHFLPDGEKMSKYLSYSGDLSNLKTLIGYCIKNIYSTFVVDIQILRCFRVLNPNVAEEFKDFYKNLDKLKLLSEDLYNSSVNAGIFVSTSIESLDRLNNNLFEKLATETDRLTDILSPPQEVQKKIFEESLAKFLLYNFSKILDQKPEKPEKLSNMIANSLLKDVIARVPNRIYYEVLIIILKFIVTCFLNDRLSPEQLIVRLRGYYNYIENFLEKKTIFFDDLKLIFDKFIDKFIDKLKNPNDGIHSSAAKDAVLNFICDLNELKIAEKKRELKYLESVGNIKTFLAEIFIFTPDKNGIMNMTIDNPYEGRIKFYEDLIRDLERIHKSIATEIESQAPGQSSSIETSAKDTKGKRPLSPKQEEPGPSKMQK